MLVWKIGNRSLGAADRTTCDVHEQFQKGMIEADTLFHFFNYICTILNFIFLNVGMHWKVKPSVFAEICLLTDNTIIQR